MQTLSNIIKRTTKAYIKRLTPGNHPTINQMTDDLLKATTDAIAAQNMALPKAQKYRLPSNLYPIQVAELIRATQPVCCVACADENSNPDYDMLAVYVADGPDRGLYSTNEATIHQLIRRFGYSMSPHEISEVVTILKQIVPHKCRCMNQDLIAVNNGIFDYGTKQLLPFSPYFVFLTKCRVDYIPNARIPVLHNCDDNTDWDVESWMKELSDDPEIVQLLWEILGAIIRPFVHWDKAAWLYSTTGNNGKGTLCELMRNLCGPGSYASIPLADFGKDFLLEPLLQATAIIVDENDVGGFIDRAANIKAVITNDVIQINRKHKVPIAYKFYGFMVQCLNEYPRIKDKSDSIYRRQLFIPFDKCFTGQERRYIKADYLKRPEVLQYVLWRVLNMNYYALSEPTACRAVLDEFKEFNDPIRQFAVEILPQCRWDLLPLAFLHDLYKSWWKKNSPSGTIQGRNSFMRDLRSILPQFPEWGYIDKVKPGRLMDDYEPLIAEYDLTDWYNPVYTGSDIKKRCCPLLKSSYKGLRRV